MGRFLITGKGGQLAKAFEDYFISQGFDYTALDRKALDITNLDNLVTTIEALRPEIIINCAAYNLVDQAETDCLQAYRVNALGPQLLAYLCKRYNCKLVHYSSDYVFDGQKTDGLYREDDRTNPLSEYGRSKLIGEKAVLETSKNHLAFRVSWLFGEGKQNFIYKLMQWQSQQDYLRISCDEFSVPTYTKTVVEVTIKAIEAGLTGLYHLTNSGFCSRYEWASFVFKRCGIKKHLHPVSMAVFDLPAKRPGFSAMDNRLICNTLNIDLPDWQEAVEEYLKSSGLI